MLSLPETSSYREISSSAEAKSGAAETSRVAEVIRENADENNFFILKPPYLKISIFPIPKIYLPYIIT
jgi:hypothetical protein